jgi:hypothetical protein
LNPAPSWRAVFREGTVRQSGEGPPAFTFRLPSENALERLLATHVYSAAMAFVGGEFDNVPVLSLTYCGSRVHDIKVKSSTILT